MSETGSSIIKYPYYMVEFKMPGRPSGKKKWIDISLTTWFKIPKDRGDNKRKANENQDDDVQMKEKKNPKKAYVLFPPPPYTAASSKIYNEYLSEKKSPPKTWQKFLVKVRGRAETLEEAHAKLTLLRKQENVWSLSEDDVALEEEAIDEIRRANLITQSQNIVHSHQKSLVEIPSTSTVDQRNGDLTNSSDSMRSHQTVDISSKGAPLTSELLSSANSLLMLGAGCAESRKSHSSHKKSSSTKERRVRTSGSARRTCETCGSPNPSDAILASLVSEMQIVGKDVKELKDNFNGFKLSFQTNPSANGGGEFITTVRQIGEKYRFLFPLQTIEEFDQFEAELGKPQSTLKKDVLNVLRGGLDTGSIIPKSVVKMLKMFISKDVAVKYVAKRIVKGKERKMITTKFYECMDITIRNDRATKKTGTPGLSEVEKAVGTHLSNASKWPLELPSYSLGSEIRQQNSPVLDATEANFSSQEDSQENEIVIPVVHQAHSQQEFREDVLLIQVPPEPQLVVSGQAAALESVPILSSQFEFDELSPKEMRMDIDGSGREKDPLVDSVDDNYSVSDEDFDDLEYLASLADDDNGSDDS